MRRRTCHILSHRKIFQSFDETIGDLSEQQTENLVVQIEQYIQALPAEKQRQIKEKLNIDELTTKTIRQLVVSQGTVIIMSIIVEVAGFAAFTTLTSFIATTVGFFGITLPFGAYIFATSAFSVITGPIGIAAMLIGGGFLLKHQNDKARRMMIPIGIVQLLLPVVIEGEQRVSADSFIAQWLPIYEEQQALQEKIKTDEQQLNVLIESSVRYRGKMNDAFHSIEQKKRNVQKQYEQIQHSIGLIDRYEQSRQYDELNKELDHIQAEIKNQKDEMAQNSRQTGFFNTIKNSFANYQIKGQVVEKDLQYARKQQELLQEIVRMKPAKLQAQCDQINIIEAELSMEKNDLADLSNEKLKIDKNISQKETELQTTKKQLKQHQGQDPHKHLFPIFQLPSKKYSSCF